MSPAGHSDAPSSPFSSDVFTSPHPPSPGGGSRFAPSPVYSCEDMIATDSLFSYGDGKESPTLLESDITMREGSPVEFRAGSVASITGEMRMEVVITEFVVEELKTEVLEDLETEELEELGTEMLEESEVLGDFEVTDDYEVARDSEVAEDSENDADIDDGDNDEDEDDVPLPEPRKELQADFRPPSTQHHDITMTSSTHDVTRKGSPVIFTSPCPSPVGRPGSPGLIMGRGHGKPLMGLVVNDGLGAMRGSSEEMEDRHTDTKTDNEDEQTDRQTEGTQTDQIRFP
eukprot:sb/3467732/